MSVPSFGVGTFRLTGQTVIDSVRKRPRRRLPCDRYRADLRQRSRGRPGHRRIGVPRDELFLTTKIWVDNYAADKLIPSLRDSLAKLRTGYVDLLLIHWPAPGNGVELREYMTALAEAKSLGLTRQIGVSNFNIELTRRPSRWSAPARSPPTRSN